VTTRSLPWRCTAIGAHVVTVIQMGDPRHMPNKSFNRGTAQGTTGLFPRAANQSLDADAAIIQSCCDLGDPFCAGGANLAVRLNSTNRYNSAALSFVVGKLNAAGVS
jgi:acetylxylan esterase